jgi:hypothetical protein
MDRRVKTVPDWQLERFRLGELPPPDDAEVREAVGLDRTVSDRLAELDRSDREILARHPPRLVAAAIRTRVARSSGAPPRLRPAHAIAASAAVLLVVLSVLVPSGHRPATREERADETRIKGLGPGLMLYRQGRSSAEPLPDGALARAHDVVQVLYVSAGRRYGVVASLDGRGTVTVHLPVGESRASPLAEDRPTPLAAAYELDDAPAFERFFFVTSEAPFDVATVTDAVGRLASREPDRGEHAVRLDLPATFEQSALLLRKDVSR